MAANSRAIWPGDKIRSTPSAAIAARGMPSYLAVSGVWAKVIPPPALISHRPNEPSVAVPERTTPTARAPAYSANERKKTSIGIWRDCSTGRG